MRSASRSTWSRTVSSTRSATSSPTSSRRPRRPARKPPRSKQKRMPLRSQVVGWGAYLPERVVTNDDLARRLDTSNDWIVQRTGIRERRVAGDGELCSDLARNAAARALTRAGIAPAEVDLLIVATTTPDNTFPSTATRVQAQLGMTGGAAFDLQAVCSGFIFGLATANNFIKARQARTAVVVGAETFSRI